jgi:hypothetical protein
MPLHRSIVADAVVLERRDAAERGLVGVEVRSSSEAAVVFERRGARGNGGNEFRCEKLK